MITRLPNTDEEAQRLLERQAERMQAEERFRAECERDLRNAVAFGKMLDMAFDAILPKKEAKE